MIVLFHVLVALVSVGYATYVFFAPSLGKLRVSYGLVGLTLASGTYLAVSNPAHILEVCLMGLAYTGAVSVALGFAQRRLATAKARR